MQKRDFKFRISANFAMFHWDIFKSDYRVSNLFISRTEVMGILGAIIGLDGYQSINIKTYKEFSFEPKNIDAIKKGEFVPEYDDSTAFWKILENLKISIKPLFHPDYVKDFLVHRKTHRINKNGNLTVNLFLLKKPAFEIVVKGDSIENDAIYEKLTHYLENNLAEFLPYMGKNGYRCNIDEFEYIELNALEINEGVTGEIHKIESLHPLENIENVKRLGLTEIEIKDWKKPNETYTYIDEVKTVFEENTNILRKDFVWTNKDCVLKTTNGYYENKHANEIIYLF